MNERRLAQLEAKLDEYARAVTAVTYYLKEEGLAYIEDERKESGYYDDYYEISKKNRAGTVTERLAVIEEDINDSLDLLNVLATTLIEKKLIERAEIVKRLNTLRKAGATNGGRIIARAWVDSEFKAKLLRDTNEAMEELGLPPFSHGKLIAVENTPTLHHVTLCFGCSCFPYQLLGRSPWWYKNKTYKQGIIFEPRKTLEKMFGLAIPMNIEIRVVDSNPDTTYLIIPERPKGTEGFAEESLAELVTVDSLIGTANPRVPELITTSASARKRKKSKSV